jgi:hypothetical protein
MPTINAFAFDIPKGFTDATNYRYRAEKPPDALSVTTEPRSQGTSEEQATSDALTQIRSRAEDGFGGEVSFADMTAVTIGGRAGHATMMTVRDVPPILYRIASVTTPQGRVAVITFASSGADPHSQASFDHCLASVRFNEMIQSPAPGYHRAYPLGISIDVPLHLRSPSVMSFLSNGERVRICVAIKEDPSELHTAIAAEVARGARIEHQEIHPYERGALMGEKSSYVSHLHGRRYAVRHAVVAAAERGLGPWLSIECRGPIEPSEMDIGDVFDRILMTVRLSTPNR